MSFNLTVEGNFDLYQTPTVVTFSLLARYSVPNVTNEERDMQVLTAYGCWVNKTLDDAADEATKEHMDKLRAHVAELHRKRVSPVFDYI